MPYYERTGMISHRHPFYGFGQNPFQMPGPWALPDESVVDIQEELPAPPIELPQVAPAASVAPVPTPKGKSLVVPFLILGGAVAIFWLTLRK